MCSQVKISMMELTNNKLYYPMLVSQDGTVGNMSHEEDSSIWRTYMTLSQLKRDLLTDQQMPLQIIRLQEQFNLKDQSIGNISLFIRKIFFGELTLEGCEAKIGSMLLTTGGGDPNQARAIVDFIQKEILTITPKPRAEEKEDSEEKSVQRTTVNLPLLQALSKYGNLGNQLVTTDRIRIKSQPDPVRPSLLYWLKCYRDELGIGQHNSVERGDFLFRSENCRKLSPKERERVNLILKSLEENLPLSIDTERQEIIFPVFQGVLVSPHQPEPLRTATPLVRRANNDFGGEKSTVPPVETPKRLAFQNSTFFSPVQGDLNDLPKKERTDQIKSSEFVGRNAPVLNSYANNALGGGGMSFSTGHIFPAEKEAIVQKAIPTVSSPSSTPSSRPAPTKKVFDDSNPFIINPSRGGGE